MPLDHSEGDVDPVYESKFQTALTALAHQAREVDAGPGGAWTVTTDPDTPEERDVVARAGRESGSAER